MTTFASLTSENATKKIFLIRMKPGRSIMNDLTPVAGNTYTYTMPADILAEVKVNGSLYAEVGSNPIASQYSYDSSTRLLTITLHTTLANIQSGGNIIAYYYLFYSNEANIYTYSDPQDSNTEVTYWEPRLVGLPSFEETQEDIVDGFLSVGNTVFAINNHDNDFQQYLTPDDSFSKKQITMWHCLDETQYVDLFYLGYVSSITLTDIVSISVDNVFSAFNETLYSYENNYSSSTFNTDVYPNLHPNAAGRPIYRLFCRSTRTTDHWVTGNRNMIPDAGSLQVYFSLDESFIASNTIMGAQTTTTNRQWGTYIAPSISSSLTLTAAGCSALSAVVTQMTVPDSSYFNPGDNLTRNGTYGYWVRHIVNSTTIQVAGPANFANGDTLFRPDIAFVQIDDPTNENTCYILVYNRDYTLSTSGTNVRTIVLVNNFEANFGGSPLAALSLWPEATVKYRGYNSDPINHSVVIRAILDSIDVDYSASAFTDAEAVEINTNFTIPYYGETGFTNASVYLQDILTSTFGHLHTTSPSPSLYDLGYKLFDTLAPTEVITNNEIIKDSLVQKIDYKDIVTTYLYKSKQGSYLYGIDNTTGVVYLDYRSESSTRNTSAEYLHERKKQKTITYVTENMTDARTRIESVLSNRRLTIEFTTKGINFMSQLGDQFEVQESSLVGDSGVVNINILGLRKSAEQTIISGIDLYDL